MQDAGADTESYTYTRSRFPLARQTVYRLGFGAMIALLLFVAFEAYRIQESVSRQTDEINRKYVRTLDVMWRIRRLMYLGSISARDYFLSREIDRNAVFRKQYEQMRSESAGLLDEFERSGGAGANAADLRARVQDFWSAVQATAERPEPPSVADAYEFVQSEIVPRRTAAGALLLELAEANDQARRDNEAEYARSRKSALVRQLSMVGLCAIVAAVIARLSLRHAARSELESVLRFEEVAQARQDLQQLSVRLLQIQEDERTRLSRELHDEIGQTLTALRIEISQAIAALRAHPDAAEQSLEEARLLAEATVATVRNISLLLRPSLLDDLGLEPALQSLVEDFGRRSGIRSEFSSQDIPEDLPETHRTCIYRVVQEALTNCARHSAASRVDIRLLLAGGELELGVSDNGKGFSTDVHGAPYGRTGLGILGMRERVAALGGVLSLDTAPGEGTRVTVRLPVRETVLHGGGI
jgi:signal transduction histidine kinase